MLSSNRCPLYKSSQFPCHLHKYLLQCKAVQKASPQRSLTVSDGNGLPNSNANDPLIVNIAHAFLINKAAVINLCDPREQLEFTIDASKTA